MIQIGYSKKRVACFMLVLALHSGCWFGRLWNRNSEDQSKDDTDHRHQKNGSDQENDAAVKKDSDQAAYLRETDRQEQQANEKDQDRPTAAPDVPISKVKTAQDELDQEEAKVQEEVVDQPEAAARKIYDLFQQASDLVTQSQASTISSIASGANHSTDAHAYHQARDKQGMCMRQLQEKLADAKNNASDASLITAIEDYIQKAKDQKDKTDFMHFHVVGLSTHIQKKIHAFRDDLAAIDIEIFFGIHDQQMVGMASHHKTCASWEELSKHLNELSNDLPTCQAYFGQDHEVYQGLQSAIEVLKKQLGYLEVIWEHRYHYDRGIAYAFAIMNNRDTSASALSICQEWLNKVKLALASLKQCQQRDAKLPEDILVILCHYKTDLQHHANSAIDDTYRLGSKLGAQAS